ncbi:DsrE family protein [Dyella sp.]|jgi:intracellular sulfur oxidation DsrE/DsrF family protein|uniref:DsrE family protein n=1 Tax=Dyella sp. TaxID=1869338 RepID=UPI002D7921A8|nr:DsrE family protein [Dyella sp.]HET6432269.1 DsrE family protein [Dyella sp.]
MSIKRFVALAAAAICLWGALIAPAVAAEPAAKPVQWVYPLIPRFGAVHPRPDLPEQPDPSVDYKVFVDVVGESKDPSKPLESLDRLARLVNLMAYAGVPAEHVHIVALLEGHATRAASGNALYRKHFKVDNPNLEILHALKVAGVRIMVCSQALASMNLDDSSVSPDVTVTLSALTDAVIYGQRGYSYMQL